MQGRNEVKLYFKDDSVTLILGDCLDVMNKLVQNNIKYDAIITDVPQQITQNTWDNIIPFKDMWEKLYKLRKNKMTPMILFTNQPFTTYLLSSNIKHFKIMKYWKKDRPSGFLNAKKMPLKDIEEIAIFYEKQCTYNPQFWEGEPLHGMGDNFKKKICENNNYNEFASNKNPSAERQGDTQKYPRQLMNYNRPHPPVHPTEKPVLLLEDLIKTYTNEGNIILDFTCGSGSTLIAAKNLNRKAVGIEIDENYCEIAKNRILQHSDTNVFSD